MAEQTSSGAGTRSDRKRERTRQSLIGAGRVLIAERGVAGLRIQEITDQADVALGSFYNHFSSKEELVETVITESLRELAAMTITSVGADADPAEIVAAANLRFIRLAYDDPDFARLVVRLDDADTLFAAAVYPQAMTELQKGIDAGRFVVTNPAVTVTAVIGGAFTLIRDILDGNHGDGAERPFTQHVLMSVGLPAAEAEAATTSAARAIGL